MSSDHPINFVVDNCYKIFVFSEHHFFCCPPLILGYFLIRDHCSFLPSLSWWVDTFPLVPPCLFSAVALHCALLEYVVLLPVVRNTLTEVLLW